LTNPTPPDEKASALAKADATFLPERALSAADIGAQFAAKATAHAVVGGTDEPGEPAELTSSGRRGHALGIALADRLAAVEVALAALEREVLAAARADNAPEMWATWANLHAALLAVRAARGRDYLPGRDEGGGAVSASMSPAATPLRCPPWRVPLRIAEQVFAYGLNGNDGCGPR
jgi:hypothetical protein